MMVSTTWSVTSKTGFRFFFLFFGLLAFPFPLDTIPFLRPATTLITEFWAPIIGFTGNTILGIQHYFSIKYNGSGDQLYNWIYYLIVLSISLIGCLVWSFLDRNRLNYDVLKKWFVFILAYYLAYYMFVYGFVKIFYLQFVPLNMERLFQTFGQASPMRLMWTFMGYSETYTMFAGFCEVAAGFLLIFRRTRTLGALIAAAVMANVFMMNMSYDIPVKLFAFQLMAIGLYIASVDFNRLVNLFITHKEIPEKVFPPMFQSKKANIVLIVIQVCFVSFFLISNITGSIERRKQYGPDREKPELYGVYDVDKFNRSGKEIPPLTTDNTRWSHLLIDYPSFVTVIMTGGKFQRYNSRIDTTEGKFFFSTAVDSTEYPLDYLYIDGSLFLDGVLYNDTLSIELSNYPLENFGLLGRGFNWVNEVPYNRYNSRN